MENGINKLIVSNTFTQEWEMEYYFNLAKELNYRVISLIVENRHGNQSIHDVPQDALNKMNNRFDIKL
jgi:phenolic acid decarboxylase